MQKARAADADRTRGPRAPKKATAEAAMMALIEKEDKRHRRELKKLRLTGGVEPGHEDEVQEENPTKSARNQERGKGIELEQTIDVLGDSESKAPTVLAHCGVEKKSKRQIPHPRKAGFDDLWWLADRKAQFVRECVVCFGEGNQECIVPCGHRCVCGVCAPMVERCPVCMVEICEPRFMDAGEWEKRGGTVYDACGGRDSFWELLDVE
uniref:RING-type domain-containing protein n=2 Tax=Hemiselmis andersenii TaxID=464988 RepID=A0A6T8P6T5_HEMAN